MTRKLHSEVILGVKSPTDDSPKAADTASLPGDIIEDSASQVALIER